MDGDFHLIIIPVALLLRTMEIYRVSMGELKFKDIYFVITGAHAIF